MADPQHDLTDPAHVGLCIVHVWHYSDRVLVRLRLRADVEDVASERVLLTADVGEALGAVCDFLTAHEQ